MTGMPDHLTCLLRNLYAGQEATLRTGHEPIDWFQIGKGVCQGCILSPCLFNLYAEYIMRNARLDEAQAGIKIARRNINNLRYAHAAAKPLQLCPTLCDPIDGSHQAPPSLGFSRQEHWSGLPFPSPMHESEKNWPGLRTRSDLPPVSMPGTKRRRSWRSVGLCS